MGRIDPHPLGNIIEFHELTPNPLDLDLTWHEHAFVRHGLDVESHLEYLPMSSMPLPSPFPVAQSENDRGSCVRTVLLRHTLRQKNLHEGLVGHVALVGQEF